MLRILLISLLGASSVAYSQTDITSWQSSHPNVLLMKPSTYDRLSSEVREQLKGKVLVYQDTPSIDELEAFSGSDLQKSMNHTMDQSEKDDQFVKIWLGTHQDVKIVPRSAYDHSGPETQAAYTANNALILSGETITIADIQNYNP